LLEQIAVLGFAVARALQLRLLESNSTSRSPRFTVAPAATMCTTIELAAGERRASRSRAVEPRGANRIAADRFDQAVQPDDS
jgi:hypothetical protein